MDAILGAAGLDDIGQLFPDSDEMFKDIYSIKLLEMVIAKMEEKGYVINNIDAILACERPKDKILIKRIWWNVWLKQ